MTLREAFEQAEIAWHDDPNDDSRNAMLEAKVAWLEAQVAAQPAPAEGIA